MPLPLLAGKCELGITFCTLINKSRIWSRDVDDHEYKLMRIAGRGPRKSGRGSSFAAFNRGLLARAGRGAEQSSVPGSSGPCRARAGSGGGQQTVGAGGRREGERGEAVGWS